MSDFTFLWAVFSSNERISGLKSLMGYRAQCCPSMLWKIIECHKNDLMAARFTVKCQNYLYLLPVIINPAVNPWGGHKRTIPRPPLGSLQLLDITCLEALFAQNVHIKLARLNRLPLPSPMFESSQKVSNVHSTATSFQAATGNSNR